MKYLMSFIVLFFFLSINVPKKDPYYNSHGKPSSWGIEKFVKDNHDNLIAEYEFLVDTIYDVYIWTEDLSKTGDGESLGEFYYTNNIIITTKESFIEYEYKNLSKYQQRLLPYTDRTVKAVIFHELTHAYFYQNIYIVRQEGKETSPEYGAVRIFPNPETRLGSTFIEEGICEYAVYTLKESAPLGEFDIPKSIDELMDKNKEVNNLYHYSVYFLKEFLDKLGLKEGIQILIQNKPPTYEEILNPELFFKRIEKN